MAVAVLVEDAAFMEAAEYSETYGYKEKLYEVFSRH